MAVLADDEMIVHGNAERARDLDDRPRHVDIGARRRRVAGGMVVHQNDRGRGELERALDHFARVNWSVVDGAGLVLLVGDEMVALVEEQDAEVLLALETHGGAAVVEHARP